MSLATTHSHVPVLADLEPLDLIQSDPLNTTVYESFYEGQIIEAERVLMQHGYYLDDTDNSEPHTYKIKFRSPGAKWPMSVTLTYFATSEPLCYALMFVYNRQVLRHEGPYRAVLSLDSAEAREMERQFRSEYPHFKPIWVPVLTDSPVV